ncbi:hypothetical protein QWZ08_04680 [Ferruginibacter paludis]|uniref:hypothetical protein n=1 Tax=Ferruginibacter paludis TaxID=1310417 RepID=UPI0025B2B910|nr:hypothetical protein [Ferruginibacter paludis]MDN3654912.1 hypothetical protein [Ferruginibacter paludis]
MITPMYIINGEEKNEEAMKNAIANDNIEKIEVLYKEKAVPIYGERAKNSVVLVTTKKQIVQPQ